MKTGKDNEQGVQFIKEGIQTANNNTDIPILFVMKEILKIRYHFPLTLAKIKLKKKNLEFTRENAGGGWKGGSNI